MSACPTRRVKAFQRKITTVDLNARILGHYSDEGFEIDLVAKRVSKLRTSVARWLWKQVGLPSCLFVSGVLKQDHDESDSDAKPDRFFFCVLPTAHLAPARLWCGTGWLVLCGIEGSRSRSSNLVVNLESNLLRVVKRDEGIPDFCVSAFALR